MKILMIECNEDELRANRTLMDTITDTVSNFTQALFGGSVSHEVIAAALKSEAEEDPEDDEE